MLQALTMAYLLAGLCFGSFANLLINRLTLGEPVIVSFLRCPSCGMRVAAWERVPVFGWIFSRGRRHCCRERVPVRYPLVEAACAGLFVCMAAYAGYGISAVPLCALAFMLLAVTCTDIHSQVIPDVLLVFGAIAGVIWVSASHFVPLGAPLWHDALLGAAAGALPLLLLDTIAILLLKKDGFGYGDVKLMAVAGLFLGWQLTLLSLFFAIMAGGAFGAVLLCSRRAAKGTYMAFGPFLAAGVLAALWFGRPFLALLLIG